MDEKLVTELTEAVLHRISGQTRPRALCVGTVPENPEFEPVSGPPFDMVVLCTLSPAELLSMPTDAVCRALLTGMPVYLMEDGLEHRKLPPGPGRILRAELMAKERRLRDMGVQLWGRAKGGLVTAADVRRLGRAAIPAGARLTPLARDLLEGRA